MFSDKVILLEMSYTNVWFSSLYWFDLRYIVPTVQCPDSGIVWEASSGEVGRTSSQKTKNEQPHLHNLYIRRAYSQLVLHS